jgi:hypothetical protein
MIFHVASALLVKRIESFTKVIKLVLMLFGIGAILSQFVQIVVNLLSDSPEKISFSNIATSSLGIILVLLSHKITSKKLVVASSANPKKIQVLVFTFPLVLTLLIFVFLKSILGFESSSYEKMMGEGGLIEYGTTLAYLLTFGFSLAIAKYFIKRKETFLGIFYYGLAIFCLVVGLEEISWGQTLLGWNSPDFFQESNKQQETNLHNLIWVHYSLRDAVIAIAFLGAFSWWFVSLLKLNRRLRYYLQYLIPDWFLSSFFLSSLIIALCHKFLETSAFIVPKDQEFAELILSLGFLFFVLSSYFRQVCVKEKQN